MLCTFYGGYCSLWPNRTARSLSRAWPSLLRAHNHIGGATAVPLHHEKCLLCSVLIYIVLGCTQCYTFHSDTIHTGRHSVARQCDCLSQPVCSHTDTRTRLRLSQTVECRRSRLGCFESARRTGYIVGRTAC